MTNNYSANAATKILRSFCAMLDMAVYSLLGFMYEIFFNVASADLFANESVLGFYKRVQLIIGVYMVFQLAVLIMKGIFNTDNVAGKNNNEFVKRIIIALVMLTVMTPISIPNPQNEYEAQINNNGLLFGTLYSLQYRILNNNTIGRLVLGTNEASNVGTETSNRKNKKDKLTQSANVFTSTILKGFLRMNLVPEEDRKEVEDGKALETLNANRMCKDIDDDTLDLYVANDTSPSDLLSLVNATCTPDTNKLTGGIYKALSFFGLTGKTKFVFSYMPIVSTVVGIIFIAIMISFTVDIAVRAIKLAVLRIIAPIPIISYMDPNGSKDGGFNSWVKTLTQTYLDLFIRLASVYFVIYIIQDMIANGIYMNKTHDVVGILSFIFICIGLFYFAKEAPKFLQQAIGMKNEPVNIFGTAMGRGAAVVGAAGSFNASRQASRLSDQVRQAAGENVDPNSLFNRGKHLLAGFAGGIGGLGAGLSAASSAKDHKTQAAFEAMQKRNRDAIAKGNSGSSFLGRADSTLHSLIYGESESNQLSREMKSLEGKSKALSSIANRADEKTKTADWTVGTSKWKRADGTEVQVTGNYKNWSKAFSAAKSQNLDSFTFNGTRVTMEEAEQLDYKLMTSNSADYIKAHGTNRTNGEADVTMDALIKDYEAYYGEGSFDNFIRTGGYGTTPDASGKMDTIRKTIKDTSDQFAAQASDKKRANAIQEANDRYSGGKK